MKEEKKMAEEFNDIKTQIINKAQTVFARFGFQKTTMDDIAQASHKGKSTLYYYFSSKEDIYHAVIEKEAKELKEEIRKAIAIEASPQDKLRTYILTRMHALKRLANLYEVFKDEYLENYKFIEKIRVSYDEYERIMISGILKEGVKREEFVIEDIELTSYAIVMATKGLEYPWAIEEDTTKIEENIDTLLHVLFYGLFKR